MTGSFLYIPINPDTKRPIAAFGGWPIEESHDYVCTIEDVENSDHEWWAIVAGKNHPLLVLDIDVYKMSEAEKAAIDTGWFGILDKTKVVKTPSGGLHVYMYTDSDFEDLPRPVEHVDLKGDVARGYVLSHPKDKYVPQNENRPKKVPISVIRELPIFRTSRARGTRESAEPIVTEEELRMKTSPPCLKKAVSDAPDSKNAFANRLVQSAMYGTVDKLSVYRIIDEHEYPESTNTEAPSFLHETPSDTGHNFRVDEGGDTFRCWRHDVTGNAYHLLGVKTGLFECGDWDHKDVGLSSVKKYARENGYIDDDDIITCESVKNNGYCPHDCGRRHPFEGVVQ